MSGNRSEKLRAVFLAFVMVTSIAMAGVAFSGSAAAQSNDQIQVSDLTYESSSDSAQSIDVSGTSVAVANLPSGTSVGAQTADSTLTASPTGGLQTAAPTGVSYNDDGWTTNAEQTQQLDIDGDGSKETVYLLTGGSASKGDPVHISLDNSIDTGSDDDNKITGNADDEKILIPASGNSPADGNSKTITFNGNYEFTFQIGNDADGGGGTNDDEYAYQSNTQHAEGTFDVDVNGDGSTETINFALVDTANDGVFDDLELSSDGTFGQSGTGSTGDDSINAAGDGDEIVDSTGETITLGSADFKVEFDSGVDASNIGDSSTDAQITAQLHKSTNNWDSDTVHTLSIDEDSDGIYNKLGFSIGDDTLDEGTSDDGTVGGSNDEILTGSSVLTVEDSSNDATDYYVPGASIITDPGNDRVTVESGFEYDHTGSTVSAYVDGAEQVRGSDSDVVASSSNALEFNLDIDDDGSSETVYAWESAQDVSGSDDALTISLDKTADDGSQDDGVVSSGEDEEIVFTDSGDNSDIKTIQIGTKQFAVSVYDSSGSKEVGLIGRNVRYDLNNDDDFADSGDGVYSEGEYLTDDTKLSGSPAGSLSADNYVEQVSGNSLLVEPVPKAGFTYDLTTLDPSRSGSNAYFDDYGVEVLGPDDGNYGSPISVTLDSSGVATISGLSFTHSSDAADESQDNIQQDDSLLYDNDGSPGGEIADIEVQSSDYGTVSVSSSVDSMTYDTAKDVTVTVTDDGTALDGAQVSLVQDDGTGSTDTLATGFTNSNGESSFSDVTPSAAGTLKIQVTADRGGTATDSNTADGITDLETSASQTIESQELQITSSDNLLKDFDATPTFTVEYANGTTFDRTSNNDGGEGVQVSISGDVIDEDDSNDASTDYKKDEFELYVTDQASSTGTPGGNQVLKDEADSASSPDETGTVTGTSGSSFTPEATGDLEVRAEYQEDGSNNGPAEYNVTETFSVTEATDLNINAQGTLTADGSADNLDVIVQGSDSNGPDGSTGNNLDTAEVSISGPGVSADTGGQVDFSKGGTFNDATQENADQIRFTPNANNNGTVEVTVNAVDDSGNEFTETTNVSVGGNNLTDLSPTGTITSSESTSVSLSLSDGAGTTLNNQQVVISEDGLGSSSTAIFKGDVNDDGTDETINKILIDGGQGTIAYDTDGDGSSTGLDATTSEWDVQNTIAVNNGVYETPELAVESAGVDVNVDAYDASNNVRAFRTDFLTTQGDNVFDVSADVDTFVAGYSEQVNVTVTNTTSGSQVTGDDLQRLADTDSDTNLENLLITQSGQSNNVIGSTNAVADADGDGTVDTIRATVTADQDTSDAVNITVRNNAQTEIGSTSSAVEAPVVSTNVTNDQLTQRIASDVDVRVLDPRDGERLTDAQASQVSNNNPKLRIDSVNGTVEIDDGSTTTELQAGGGTAEPTEFDTAQMGEANNSVAMLAYPDGESGPQRIQFDIQLDAGYLGSSNVTVAPPQVEATPSSVSLGASETLEVVAEDANGQALDSRTIQIDGAVNQRTGSTDSSGFVAFQIAADATGTINVRSASDSDVVSGTQSPAALGDDASIEDTVNVTTEQSDFDVTVDPQTVTANQSSTVTVTATNNATGDAAEGASVDLSGAGVNASAQTDANGEAALDVNASETGTIDVTVDNAGFNPATATITVAEPTTASFQLELVDGTTQIVQNESYSATVNVTNEGGAPALSLKSLNSETRPINLLHPVIDGFDMAVTAASDSGLPHRVYSYTRIHTEGSL